MGTWWKERVFYQIYPRSFQDSNGDGIGDLRGIIRRLDYLKELGVGAVWLSPIYDSPNADMGYDIRDYEKIMTEFGTMEDFDELLREMHKRDIKLIMDLVVNHTSDEHRWFKESRKSRDNPYRDYYIWRDGQNGQEPNNWVSFFAPSAWHYDEGSSQWYLHLFADKQPDLNWENPRMRREIYDMINRWFDKGVDGFRMDAISFLAKEPGLPSGSGEGRYVFSPEHYTFQPRLHDYLREMRRECFDGRDCMSVGETSFVTTDIAKTLVEGGQEMDLLFQFDIVEMDGEGGKWNVIPFDLSRFKKIINDWQHAIDWNTLFWGNHDQPRIVSRFGCTASEELRVRSAKMLATAMYLLRGTPFLYQGEEIGMTNYPFTCEAELRDIESFNLLEQNRDREDWAWWGIRAKGRDNSRTPMQWTDAPNAGFTTGTPWIGVNPNYREINVEKALAEEDSVLHFYRRLIALRSGSKTLQYGDFTLLLPDDPQLFAYKRTLGDETILVCCNFSGSEAAIPAQFAGERLLAAGADGDTLLPYGAVAVRIE